MKIKSFSTAEVAMFVIKVEKKGKWCLVKILVFPETFRDDCSKNTPNKRNANIIAYAESKKEHLDL